MYTRRYNIMKKRTKITLGFGVAGLSGIGIFTILKKRKPVQQAFDDVIEGDDTVETDSKTDALADNEPEFTKYTGIPVDSVTTMLNEVTFKANNAGFYYIIAKDFEAVRKSLGVFDMYLRYNYTVDTNGGNIIGDMINFRIHEDDRVLKDGWFLISGVWKYLPKDEVLDDRRRCAININRRQFQTDNCFIK
jgi:hypothetical protein